MTTYTIYQPNRSPAAQSGMSVAEAAHVLLKHDGGEYKICEAQYGSGFTLWHRKPNAGRNKWIETVIYSSEDTPRAAAREIFQKVINSGRWENDNLSCMTDAAYGEMLAELEAE